MKIPNLSAMEKTMPNLKNSPKQARNLLSMVDHATFQSMIDTHWRFAPDGRPTAPSVLWLFCYLSLKRRKPAVSPERPIQPVKF